MIKLPYYLQVTDKVKYEDSKYFRIRINPKYVDDVGLLAHGKEHVRQWYFITMCSMIIPLLVYLITGRQDYTAYALLLAFNVKGLGYTFIRSVRLKLEVLAYRKQMEALGSDNYRYFAGALASESNNFKITLDEAEELLRKG